MKQRKIVTYTLALLLGLFYIYFNLDNMAFTVDRMANKESAVEHKDASSFKTKLITESEKELLAKLVHAEAKGEPFEGKVAVAEVVLNRVENDRFPDTVKGVIYQKNAFEPVENGSINQQPSEEAEEAVEEALKENDSEYVYFYNPETASSSWIFSRPVVEKIGNHAFAV